MVTRITTWLIVALAGTFVGSCTAIIDVDADCDDAECAPAICAPDGVACMKSCSSNDDCFAGNRCDTTSNRCVQSSCVHAVVEGVELREVSLAMPSTMAEMSSGFAVNDEGEPSQFFVASSSSSGFGFRRFSSNGVIVPDPPAPAESPLVPVVGTNPERRLFTPVADFLNRTDSAADGSTPRFVYAFADVSRDQDLVQFGTFVIDPASAPAYNTVFTSPRRSEVTGVDFELAGDQGLVAWRSRAADDSIIQAYATGFRGENDQAADALDVSEEGAVVGEPHISVIDDNSYLIVYDRVLANDQQVAGAVITRDDVARFRGRLLFQQGRNAFENDVLSVRTFNLDGYIFVIWVARSSAGDSIQIARFAPSDIAELNINNRITFANVALMERVERVNAMDVDVREEAGEFAIFVAGQARPSIGATSLVDGLHVQRFNVDAITILEQATLREFTTAEVVELDVHGIDDIDPADGDDSGYATIYLNNSNDGADVVVFDRFTCRAP